MSIIEIPPDENLDLLYSDSAHTKDIQGRFKNKKKISLSSSQKQSVQFSNAYVDIEETDDDVCDDPVIEFQKRTKSGQRRSSIIVRSSLPGYGHPPKRRQSRSSVPREFSLLRGGTSRGFHVSVQAWFPHVVLPCSIVYV